MNFINKLAAGIFIFSICFFSLAGAQETKDNNMENNSYKRRLKVAIGLWDVKLTDKQLQFAANNFYVLLLGKMEPVKNIDPHKLRSYNPDIILLKYMNARHAPGYGYMYEEIKNNDKLFIYDDNGKRIKGMVKICIILSGDYIQ